jgi:hypothetical protein
MPLGAKRLNLRHRYLLRAMLGPGALLVVAAIAYVGIEVYELDSAVELRWLVVVSLLAFILMLLALLRMESVIEQRAQVRSRERNLMEQQRAFDRLHAGINRLRSDPGKTRWLKLAEASRVTDPNIIAGWERRYQELLAHPTRRAWAAEALKGRFPSDAEIDYEAHPHMLLTCIHLQPIESAIRAADIYCTALSPTSIVTFASLHASKARRHFSLPSFVEWEDIPATATSADTASLVCRQCGSRIQSGTGEPFPP